MQLIMLISEAILNLKQSIEDAVETFIRETATTTTTDTGSINGEFEIEANANTITTTTAAAATVATKLREDANRFIAEILQLYGVCIQTVAIIEGKNSGTEEDPLRNEPELDFLATPDAPTISSRQDDKFPCPQCEKSYAFERNLIEHLRFHRNPSEHTCPVCRVQIKSRRNLAVHMQTHEGVKPFTCPEPGCNRSYNRASILKDHMRRHQGGTFDYVCEVCGRGFYTKNDYKKHCKVHGAPEERRRFKCTVEGCKESFTAKTHLQTHGVVHTGERPHKCGACGMDFKHLSTLHKHQKTEGKCRASDQRIN